MQNFYFKNRTIEAKRELGKYEAIRDVYKHNFSPSKKIGNCTNLFRKLRPTSEKDFCDKYFQYAEEHKYLPISERGLTYEEYQETIRRYMEMANKASGMDFPYETYFNELLSHIITETYEGQIMEAMFVRFLESLGYECGFFDGRIDAKYGVDIKVTRKIDGKTSAIQIKPISFFKGKKQDIRQDQIKMVYKYYDFLSDYGIKTYYAIYVKDNDNGNIFWLKNGNGFRFKLNELFTYDANDIDGTLKVKYIKDDFHYLNV